jgi:hypothetical protein
MNASNKMNMNMNTTVNTTMNTLNNKFKSMISSMPSMPSMPKSISLGSSVNLSIHLVMLLFIILSIILIIYYVSNEVKKKTTNDRSMKKDLDQVDKIIKSINLGDASYKQNLRDYYIMSSYNCCCNGDFDNGYVSLDSLKNVIFRGARVLDMEIYSVDGNTVVAASSNNNFFQKGTYNSIPLADVISTIENYAFSASTCPNYNDPLFLHFRIKSNTDHVYKDMASILSSAFNGRRLDQNYMYESHGENIGAEPIANFMGKVVFMVDKSSNPKFEGTHLDEIINFASGSPFLQNLRNYDVLYAPNGNLLIENNKKNMSITMPDFSARDTNMSAGTHFKYGCQMVCMNFQNVDTNLIFYLEQFNEAGSAFILKPQELRYQPTYATAPTKQDPSVSFAPKKISKPYFSHEL